jgi:predicted transcriptional regulator
MDTYSLTAAARMLRTTVPRVRRAVDRLGIEAGRSSSGAFLLTQSQVDELASVLGIMPLVPGLSPTEARVLAALSRSPRGVASVREAARRAGTSPTATARAIDRLTSVGLIVQTHAMLARGRATEARVYQVPFAAPQWLALAPAIAQVQLPAGLEHGHATRVPPHLLHLFWNVAPAQLDVASSAPFIARRLISSFDPDGLAWGSRNLPASAWQHAAATRGLEPAKQALARNLARTAPDAR